MKLLIGSRGSKLALTQTEQVAASIRAANPGLATEIIVIKTQGDLILDKPLNELGSKGVFVREIEEALLSGQIDLAVHSLKDLPAEQPPGLTLAVTPRREDPRDFLVCFGGEKCLAGLAPNSVIATGSLRRIGQLQALRPDITCAPMRGNVETRLRKAKEQGLQGVLLAAAGLSRLGLIDKIAGFALEPQDMLPAPAQGILGLETRADDTATQKLLLPLHDEVSHRQMLAERAFLKFTEGGCHAPIGAYCEISNASFTLCGFFQTDRGLHRKTISGRYGEEAAAGAKLAQNIKEMIANE